MYLYRLAKMYMKSATNIAALEEALEIYDGGAYSGKVRAIYENRLEEMCVVNEMIKLLPRERHRLCSLKFHLGT